jgi:hypothetical protein
VATAAPRAALRAAARATPRATPAGAAPTVGADAGARRLLEHEARALLTRLARVRPFALSETTVPAAAFTVHAQAAIERYLATRRRELRGSVKEYLAWLASPDGARATVEEAHRRFVYERLRFNVVLSHFDMFSEVQTQRSEHETGVFLAGLDAVAADAIDLPDRPYEPPPVICYLQRGHGASIRRARTRLPGGGENPVAIIAVPRERMVGSGVASSLVHEVGHQGAALLGLVESVRPVLQRLAAGGGPDAAAWQLFERWSSEVLADLWSVARVGVASTLGLMGVVALPRPFVFRRALDAPHPIPWIRVKLSCVMGEMLYPHPQWARLAALWERFYPAHTADAPTRALLALLQAHARSYLALLLDHRPKALGGRSVRDALRSADREPARLAARFAEWERAPLLMRRARPALVFAAVGQAKMDGRITPEQESRVLGHLLTYWALRSTIDAKEICVSAARRPARAAAT